MDSLPDDILIHILSFLPMKQAASTSVLSKRWRTLFAFTHNLDFSDPFKYKSEEDDWYELGSEDGKIFRNFVCRTLALQAGSFVKKLSLTLERYHLHDDFNHWIRYALKHGVSQLHLHIHIEMSSLTKVFISTTLVKLSLGSSMLVIFDLPSNTYLPSLKVLSLAEIEFVNDQLSDELEFNIVGQLSDVLLAGCPVLEDFAITNKDFPLFSCDANYPDFLFSKTIKNLYYCGKPLYTDYQFDLLVKATLDFRFCRRFNAQNLEKLMNGIRNIKTLHLTAPAIEVISQHCKDKLPVFINLVDLEFPSSNQEGWGELFRKKRKGGGWRQLLSRFLESSPNLKVLLLSGLHLYTFNGHSQFVGIQIPLENKIEKLCIKRYKESANELRHISHLLLKMKHLKVMKVYVAFTKDEPKKMQLKEDLMKLPTVSDEVKIQVI